MAITAIFPSDPNVVITIITVLGSVAVSIIGGYYAHVLSRKPVVNRKDIQDTLNDTFRELTEQLHKHNSNLLQRVEELEQRVNVQDQYIRMLQLTLYAHEIPVPERPDA